ncbi:MAG: prephenate dehydratase [Hyphomicrobiales bacterium]|nr:prephenate dehydratase [Hyphomicrobiales bacterium]
MADMQRIAFQGEPGANSHIACREVFPDMEAMACATFEDALAAVSDGSAQLGMIPIENSVAGRVADIHHLLPDSGLFIVGEHFLRVRHCLLGIKGARLADLKEVHSHTQALGQCRAILRELGLEAVPTADTAGAARRVAERGDKNQGAIATRLAAEIYGLAVLKSDIEDEDHNTTRFIIVARERKDPPAGETDVITSFIFRVRNVPAALYKAMGGFATNGVNMTKLESYQLGGTFNATQFYADIEGHPSEHGVKLAFEELEFFTTKFRVLGAYKASPLRRGLSLGGDG